MAGMEQGETCWRWPAALAGSLLLVFSFITTLLARRFGESEQPPNGAHGKESILPFSAWRLMRV